MSVDELRALGYRIVDRFVEEIRVAAARRGDEDLWVVSTSHHDEFELAEWTVRPAVNELRRDGEVRNLEPRVMRLLTDLAEHAGRVRTRPELLAAVWGTTMVNDESLTSAVSRLRAALGDSPADQRYLQTVRGVGYRLVPEVRRAPCGDARSDFGTLAPTIVGSRSAAGRGDQRPSSGTRRINSPVVDNRTSKRA